MRLFVPLMLALGALAVACGGGGDAEREREIADLTSQITELRENVDALEASLAVLAARESESAEALSALEERLRPRTVVSREIVDGPFIRDRNGVTVGVVFIHCVSYVEEDSSPPAELCLEGYALFDDAQQLDETRQRRTDAAIACYERTTVGDQLPDCWL